MRIGAFLLAGQYPGQSDDEALARTVRTAGVAEEAGLHDVWLAEHHFVPYGVCPSAATLAGYLLGRTERIGVGTAVSVLPTAHPVALGEQAALLHLASDGRFTLGVGRGGPWIDLRVFGGGRAAYEHGFPEALDLLLRWVTESEVGADGERYRFPTVPVVPRPRGAPRSLPATAPDGTAVPAGEGPPVVVACTSPRTVRLAATRGLPMLLGMHSGDGEKAEMVALWRDTARDAGFSDAWIARAPHVSAGVAQVADTRQEAVAALRNTLPGWLHQGLAAHRTVDGEPRAMRDPHAYTELLCELHPVGPPRFCADRLAATAEATGIERFALLVEGTGTTRETERNVRRLGAEVLPLLPGGVAGVGTVPAGGADGGVRPGQRDEAAAPPVLSGETASWPFSY